MLSIWLRFQGMSYVRERYITEQRGSITRQEGAKRTAGWGIPVHPSPPPVGAYRAGLTLAKVYSVMCAPDALSPTTERAV